MRCESRDRDLEREIRAHLEEEAREQEEAGLAADSARNAARRAFGNTTLIKEATREMWGWTSWERLLQDLRYSARTLLRTPGFTAAAALSLALGIGANTAIFSLLNAVVLRMLPVRDPQQLVQLTYTGSDPGSWNSYFDYPQFECFRDRSQTLAAVFARTWLGDMNVLYRGKPGLAQGEAFTDNFFSALGVTPQHGRLFSAGDDTPASTVVLSDRFWRNRFGGDPSVIGETLTINQLAFTVIGITPPEFRGISVGSEPDLWLPLHVLDRFKPSPKRWTETFTSWLVIAARLKPGVTMAQAQAEADVMHRQLIAEQLSVSEIRDRESAQRFVRDSHLVLRSASGGIFSGLRDNYELPLKLLMCVAGIVLLVACANVANLLLARASNRRREIGVRLALGAGRLRLVRQLITESLMLSAAGGALALLFAWWGSATLVRMISTGDSPIPLDVRPDWKVFGFTAAASLVTGLLFGLAPALRGTRVDPARAMSEGVRSAGRKSQALDRVLVVAQIALSVVLVAGAGLFTRTLQKLWSVNVGYDRENVLMFSLDAKLAGYPADRAPMLYRQVLERLQALPDVRSASASIVRPVDDAFSLVNRIDQVDGRTLGDRNALRVSWNSIGPAYFATVQTPMVLGREFDFRDTPASPPVVIVNELLAARAFPGVNPIGHKLDLATVVGVVKDSLYNGPQDKKRLILYHPLFQHSRNQEFQWGFASFEMRYSTDANITRPGPFLVEAVRREVAAVDRNLPIFRVKTLRAQAEQALVRERLLATLSTFFGGLALLLACLGLYGLMAYAVARRTGEVGIRMALGARRGHVMWLVLRETFGLALAGIAAGIPLALWTARYAKSLLFGIDTADPMTIAVTIAALTGVACVAGYIPARRAMRVDPMVALRWE